MNDESKKLKLFEKEYALVEHTYASHQKEIVLSGWLGGMEEALAMICHEYARGRRGVTALSNVRRAILGELGLTGDVPKHKCKDCCHVMTNKHGEHTGCTINMMPVDRSIAIGKPASDILFICNTFKQKSEPEAEKFVPCFSPCGNGTGPCNECQWRGRICDEETKNNRESWNRKHNHEPKAVEPDSLCPLVFGSDACGYDMCGYEDCYSSCDKTFDDCRRLGNAKNFGGIGYDGVPDAKEPGMIIGNSPEDCDKKAAVVRESFNGGYCDCPYDDNCKSLRGRCASTPNLERKKRLAKPVRQLQFWRAAAKFYGVTKHGDK